MRTHITHGILTLALSFAVVGCANNEFQNLSKGILSSTGLVSASQADAMFAAGGKLVKAAGPLTEEQEYYVGRSVSALILSKYKVYHNAEATRYLNLVGAVVAGVSERPETFSGYHFTILDTQEVNALSAPGGFVFVTRGLLAQVLSEEALAAVLAHEIAHIVKAHGVGAIKKANLTEALTILGKEAASSYGSNEVQLLTNAFGDSVNEVFEKIVKDGYSRSQEYDADEYAVELLQKSGYAPRGLGDMLSKLVSLEKKNERGGWFDTHPAPSDRQDELDDDAQSEGKSPQGIAIRTARFKNSLKL